MNITSRIKVILLAAICLIVSARAQAGAGVYSYKNPATLRMMQMNFDPEFYFKKYPKAEMDVVKGIYLSAFEHYLAVGAKQGYNPSSSFDETSYLSKYPKIKKMVKDGQYASGFEHWASIGKYTGFVPTVSIPPTSRGP